MKFPIRLICGIGTIDDPGYLITYEIADNQADQLVVRTKDLNSDKIRFTDGPNRIIAKSVEGSFEAGDPDFEIIRIELNRNELPKYYSKYEQ